MRLCRKWLQKDTVFWFTGHRSSPHAPPSRRDWNQLYVTLAGDACFKTGLNASALSDRGADGILSDAVVDWLSHGRLTLVISIWVSQNRFPFGAAICLLVTALFL